MVVSERTGRAFEIFVSIENSQYMLWQALLLHYNHSMVYGSPPVFVVHEIEPDEPLQAGFDLIERRGGVVRRAPSYSRWQGQPFYPARNSPGTLDQARSKADVVVVTDPDIIFLRPIDFADLGAASGVVGLDSLGLDGHGYMSVNGRNRGFVGQACTLMGLDIDELAAGGPYGGVPNFVTRDDRAAMAEAWLLAMNVFDQVHVTGCDWWGRIMWAFVLGAKKAGFTLARSDLTTQNWPDPPLRQDRSLIHYSPPTTASFSKNRYMTDADVLKVWDLEPQGTGTVNDRVIREIRAAASYYGLTDPVRRPALLGL